MLDCDTLIKYSDTNYTSVEKPFFSQDNSDKSELRHKYNYETIELYKKQMTELNLSDEIQKFYIKYQMFDRELYIGQWTFFTIDQMIEHRENTKNDEIYTVDLAFKYRGMGHILIMFYNRKTGQFLYRYDGGSNGYDREYNYNRLKNYIADPDKYLDMYEEYQITNFDDFLTEIQKTDEYCE